MKSLFEPQNRLLIFKRWIKNQLSRAGLYYSFRYLYVLNVWATRRFSKGGFLVISGIVASGVVGIDTRRTLGYQIFAVLFLLLLFSICMSFFSRAKYKAERILPDFGTAGEKLTYKILISGSSKKNQKGLLFYEDTEDPRPTLNSFMAAEEPGGEKRNFYDRAIGYYRWLWLISRKKRVEFKEMNIPAIPPGIEIEMTGECMPLRRGVLRFPGCYIACPDPFGLFKNIAHIDNPQKITVLPKRYPIPHFKMPGKRTYQKGGVLLASSVGESEEFISLRDYRPGDPLRNIHWKSFAKTGTPIVKEFQDEYFVRHALILDTFDVAEYSDIFEEAVSVAASFICSVKNQDSLLDLMFVGSDAYVFTSGRGLARSEKMLEILSCVKTCPEKSFSTLVPVVLERSQYISGCICVLLSWDQERKSLVDKLIQSGIPVLTFLIEDGKKNKLGEDDIPENFFTLRVGRIEEGLSAL